jgi:tripartite ATP-independent transporter DctM subunit
METLWMLLLFFAMILAGFSMSVAMGASALVGLYLMDIPSQSAVRIMIEQLRSITLLAVPFFILAANLLSEMRIADRIFRLANHATGRLPGGLAQVNVVSTVLFSGASGSALADIGGMGLILVRAMERQGYRAEFAAAVSVVASIITPLIPPSIMFIIYAVNTNTSIAALFIAGIVPGLLFAAALVLTIVVMAVFRLERFPVVERSPFSVVVRDTLIALPAVATPVFVLGGIIAGITTPTEAALVAVFYTLFLGLIYGELTWQRLWNAFLNTCTSTSVIMILTAIGAVMAYVVISSRAADTLAGLLLGISDHPLFIVLAINLFLVVLGMLIETVPAMLIAIPLLAPVALKAGMDPVHFGVLLVFNLLIGIITPPTGIGVFTISAVTGVGVDGVFRATLPFYVTMFLVLAAIALVPPISLWLPGVLMGD